MPTNCNPAHMAMTKDVGSRIGTGPTRTRTCAPRASSRCAPRTPATPPLAPTPGAVRSGNEQHGRARSQHGAAEEQGDQTGRTEVFLHPRGEGSQERQVREQVEPAGVHDDRLRQV